MTGLGGPNFRKPESSSSKGSTRRAGRWAELSLSPYLMGASRCVRSQQRGRGWGPAGKGGELS